MMLLPRRIIILFFWAALLLPAQPLPAASVKAVPEAAGQIHGIQGLPPAPPAPLGEPDGDIARLSPVLPLPPGAVHPEERLFGVELEYALSPAPIGDTKQIPAETYMAPLQIVGKHFPLTGPATSRPDEKFEEGHLAAVAVDFDGRQWKVNPDTVDERDKDGVELITPPLSGRRNARTLAAIHRDILSSGGYRRGISSSAHFTFDVSDLISPEGNAARLVDAILFIENHWPEIYAAVSPTRNGTIVNDYAVPLALDHPELLYQLAAMPRKERTFDAVKALFGSYTDAENAVKGGDSYKSWKNRAANYGKVLGLHCDYTEKPLSVIEFRIADLPDGQDIQRLHALYAAILSRAPPQDRFEPPFEPRQPFSEANARIVGQDRAAYNAFLRSLGLKPADYPFLRKLDLFQHPIKKIFKPDSEQTALAILRSAAGAALSDPHDWNNGWAFYALGLHHTLGTARILQELLNHSDPSRVEYARELLVQRTDKHARAVLMADAMKNQKEVP